MRSKKIIGLMLAFGIAFSMISASGVGPSLFGVDDGGHGTAKTLDEVAKDAEIGDVQGEGVRSDVGGDNEPTIIGFVFSAGAFTISLVSSIALLPATLMNLGFPSWAAIPIGGGAQIIGTIGFVQFVTGREYL